MSLGEHLRVTLFGESHGLCVGALVEGLPPNLSVDEDVIAAALALRRPGGPLASKRAEQDICELLSGVHQNRTTGYPVLLLIRNSDARSSDYSFLPNQPRPGHADLPTHARTSAAGDLRGGGSSSARLTAGLVAAAALCAEMVKAQGWQVRTHTCAVGEVRAPALSDCCEDVDSEVWQRIRCYDDEAGKEMISLVEEMRERQDSVGSSVEFNISGLPLGLGEPWFDGVEPALARGLMAIPAARAVEFGRGVQASTMCGSEHNDPWQSTESGPRPAGKGADGALGGFSTGAPLSGKVHFKPPSSIGKSQQTLNLDTGKQEELQVEGRHDPVIAPRATIVVESVVTLITCDLFLRMGWRA